MNGLTVFSVLRNGVLNGYPFVEAYASWLGHCDRIVVLDGQSDDGTWEVLEALRALDERIEVHRAPWPAGTRGGTAIADFTNTALALASDGAERLVYVQADEIFSEEQRSLMAGWQDGALEFTGCFHFWNGTDRVLANKLSLRYVRVFHVDQGATAIGDGITFSLADGERRETSELFLHYGWCFPTNILQKHISHARIYRGDLAYATRGRLARAMLRRGIHDRALLDALAPEYKPVPFEGQHPTCMRHLLGARVYDPYLGLELLRSGIRW
jgi:hypothetical protein